MKAGEQADGWRMEEQVEERRRDGREEMGGAVDDSRATQKRGKGKGGE